MRTQRRWHLLGVPIDCLAAPGGTELAPGALRDAGLVDRSGLVDAGDVTSRLRDDRRDAASGVIAYADVVKMTTEVARRTGDLVADGAPLLIVGGCCTLVPAAMAGVRRHFPQAALVYLDGHLDLYDGTTSPTGEAADMPLAVALGRGPDQWQRAADVGATLNPGDVTLLGPRDHQEAAHLGSLLPSDLPGLTYIDAAAIIGGDAGAIGRDTVHRLAASHPDGFWVHLDLDILDETAFPATDYLSPGGISRSALLGMLRPLVESPAIRGLSVACYNPEKDAEHKDAAYLVDLLTTLLTE